MHTTSMSSDPVFVLSAGARTGSTLVQRLITSTRDALVWGEHDGQVLALLDDMERALRQCHDRGGARQFQAFLESGPQAWIANMVPAPDDVRRGLRAFLEAAFGAPAAALGYRRWGFKEIRYGAAQALYLQGLYPDARFVFVVRRPADCLRSYMGVPWYDHRPDAFLARWVALATELDDVRGSLRHAVLVRFEDLAATPDPVIERIAATIGVAPSSVDRGVLSHLVRGAHAAPVMLGSAEAALVEAPAIAAAAARFGYRSGHSG